MEKVKNIIVKIIKSYHKYIISAFLILLLFISGIIVNAKNTNEVIPPLNYNLETNQITVEIIGDVAYPGKYQLNSGTRVLDLLKIAGYDLNENTDLLVNKNSLLENNDIINIPHTIKNSNRININTANLRELMLLKSIGETKASNIILYRKINGSFKTIDDLLKVDGITSKVLLDIINEIKLS